MQMAIYRSCTCLELNKLKSPLKVEECCVDILTWLLLVWYWWPLTAVADSVGLTGLKTPTLLVPLRQASFCVKDAASCLCDAVFLSCGRGFTLTWFLHKKNNLCSCFGLLKKVNTKRLNTLLYRQLRQKDYSSSNLVTLDSHTYIYIYMFD